MDPDRWQELSRLFHEASTSEGAERDALLRRVETDDPGLGAELRELLAVDEEADVALKRRVGGAARALEDDVAGRMIGPYRVVREQGRGGMGRVFLCERDDGHFDQVVAVKLLHGEFAGDELRARFRRERQILARLEHPNIARLLDGGVTDDGQPYFALEYVDGEPIDRYCDRHELDVEQRLRLFQEVCEALAYAHASLVVHRDLKPDNILVTGDGRVKLLDFGIATVLAKGDGLPARTRTAMFALTPSYASPEQVRGEPVGTATDVYSLGVILYELLTGVRPYEIDGRSPTAVEAAVCGSEPERPSTRVARDTSTAPDSAAAVGRKRRTDPARLRKRLSGDLDVICMKALRKEPERRYGSIGAFLDDITRHLDGRTVQARPATLGYRLGKAIRRNRWAVGAAATVLLSSSTIVAFYTARLAEERDAARIEADKAREVAGFLQSLFEISDPDEARGQTITARELLDEGAREVDEGLAGQPEVQAAMLRVIGEVYGTLGMPDRAQELLTRAHAMHVELYGPDALETGLTRLSLASTVQDGGIIEDAGPLFRDAVATLRRVLPPSDPTLAEAVEQYAYWLETDGQIEAADAEYRRAIADLRASVPPDDPTLTALLSQFGNFLRNYGAPEEAEPLLREALARQRAAYGRLHGDVASTMRQLASLLRDADRFEEADSLYREVLDIRRTLLGDVHPEVAVALNSHAILLSRMGEHEEALQAYLEHTELMGRIHDEPHPDVAAAHHNLATQLTSGGDAEAAIPHFQRSLEIQEVVYRPGHPNRAFPLVGLASAYRDLGRLEEAESLLRRALALRVEALPEGHRHTAEARSNLGAVLMDQGRYAEAEPLLLEAYETLLEGQGPEAGRTRVARARVARLYEETGRPEEAARYAEPVGG